MLLLFLLLKWIKTKKVTLIVKFGFLFVRENNSILKTKS